MQHYFVRRPLALLLGAAMCLLTACGGSDGGGQRPAAQGEPQGGRYVETALALPEDIHFSDLIREGKEGPLYLYGMRSGGIFRYRVDEEAEPPALTEDTSFQLPLPEEASPVALAGDDAGSLYVTYRVQDTLYLAKAEGGALSTLPVPEADPAAWYRDLLPLADGGFLLGSYDSTLFLEKDGLQRSALSGPMVMGTGLFEGQAAVLLEDHYTDSPPALVFYDPATGEESSRVDATGVSAYPSLLVPSGDGRLYLCNQLGLFRLKEDKGGWETRIATDQSSLSLPDKMVSAAAFLKNGDLLAFTSGNTGEALYRYHLDPTLPAQADKTLRITTVLDKDILHVPIPAFTRLHPDIQPQVEERLNRNSGATRSDVVKAINTELLAGKGADVYVLDYLPLASFIEKGVLCDLTPLVQPLLESGELMENIVGCYGQDGKLGAVPLRFQVPLLFGGSQLIGQVKTLEDLAAWAEAHPDPPLFSDNTAQRLFYDLFPVCAPAWLDGAGLGSEGFAAFLTSIQQIAGLYPAPEDGEAGGGWDIVGLRRGENQAALEAVTQMSDLLREDTILKELGDGGYIPLPGQAQQRVFLPQIAVGVNAQSALKEAALEYVGLLLGEEAQSLQVVMPYGLPVNRKALEYEAKGGVFGQGAVFSFGEETLAVDHWLDEAAQRQFLDLCASLTTPGAASAGNDAMNLLSEEADRYFRGEVDAAQAAQAARDRVQAMLQE